MFSMKKARRLTAIISSLAIMASLSAFTASAASAQQTYKLGDVDLSGTIDLDDLTCMKKGIFWLSQLSDVQKRTADIDQNGHVDLKDLAALKLHLAGISPITGEVTVSFDENGNVAEYADGNTDLRVYSDSYNAEIVNSADGSRTALSDYYMSYSSGDASAMISPWYSELKYNTADSSLVIGSNDYTTSSKTVYSNGESLGINYSQWGINVSHSAMAKETAPFMRKTYNFFANTSEDNNVFTQTGYGVDQTVALVNAEVTKREGGIEFVNHVSDDTVNSFMADDYVTIDGVKLSYSGGEFTVEGIPENEIELLHTMTVDQYDEIAVVTNTPGNRFVYGLMYDKSSQSMAALVKVRLDKNAEATVIQYSKPADMATTINFYPKDGVLERAMANPDEMVTLFDTQYDPDHLVFQTVHFPRMTKNLLAGSLNARYQITNGITYKQTAGNASVKLSYGSTSSTLAFNNTDDTFSLINTESGSTVGITSGADTVKYDIAGSSFTTAGKYYSPDCGITYTYGTGSSAFTPAGILAQHTPFMF